MGSTTTLVMSLAIGVALIGVTLFMGYLILTYNINANLLKWVLLPTVGYGITLGFNAFIQNVTCGSVNIKQIAMGSLTVPIAILFGLLLCLSPFIRSPVEAAFRGTNAMLYAIAFYMFWAGMFGMSVASGFSQSCGDQSLGSPLPK